MSESRLGHVVNLIYCSHQISLVDWRQNPDDDQWLKSVAYEELQVIVCSLTRQHTECVRQLLTAWT